MEGVRWCSEADKLLIMLVRARRCLYVSDSQLYGNKEYDRKDIAWTQITEKLVYEGYNFTVIQCKHRWDTLRNRYSKSSKLLQLSTSEPYTDEGSATCSFPYNEEMEFMLEHIKRRRPRKRFCYPFGSLGHSNVSSQAENASNCDSEPAEVSRHDESLDNALKICIPSPSSGEDTRVELERRQDNSQNDMQEIRSETCSQFPKKKRGDELSNSPNDSVATEMQQNQVVTSESERDEPIDGFLSYVRSELIRRAGNERNIILAEFMQTLARNPTSS